MIRILALLIALSIAGPAYACQELLVSRFTKLRADNFVIATSAKLNLGRMQVQPKHIGELIAEGKAFVVDGKEKGEKIAILFDEYADKDRGIYLSMTQHNEQYVIRTIHWSDRDDEMSYYRAIADDHWMREEQLIPLGKELLSCRELIVAPWVRIKLWLKHDLTLKDVAHFIDNSATGPQEDMKYNERSSVPRFLVHGLDRFKRQFVAVVANERACKTYLVTAYALHHHSH